MKSDFHPRIHSGLVATMIVALAVLAGCREAATPDVRGIPATIVLYQGRYVLVSDSTGLRYIPDRIPYSYRVDGLDVYLTGRTAETPDRTGAREVAIEVTSISQRTE